MKTAGICMALLMGMGQLYAQELAQRSHTREADVMWSRKVWRVLDLRQKFNHTFYYPLKEKQDRRSLFMVIEQGLRSGELTAFDPGVFYDQDEFRSAMNIVDVDALLSRRDSVSVEDLDTGLWKDTVLSEAIETAEIVQYKLKEEWYFDKQRSVLDVKILGIAPMVAVYNEFEELLGYRELFWIPFDDLRPLLHNEKVMMRSNSSTGLTFDDLFWKRMFHSYIVKVDNVYDRAIADHTSGIDALLEGEAITEEIRNFESDLWSN